MIRASYGDHDVDDDDDDADNEGNCDDGTRPAGYSIIRILRQGSIVGTRGVVSRCVALADGEDILLLDKQFPFFFAEESVCCFVETGC